MTKRNTSSKFQELTIIISVVAFLLLAFTGCNRTGDGTAPGVGVSNKSFGDKESKTASDDGLDDGSLTESDFVELLRSGLSEKADFTASISEIIRTSGSDAKSAEVASLTIRPITEASDQYRLKYWKDFIERDRFIDLSTVSAIGLVDVRIENSGDSSSKKVLGDENFSTFLFLKMKSKPDWIFWVRQLHEGMLIKFDTSINRSEFDRLVRNGLNDKTDLTDKIRQDYSFERKKQSEPGLKSYTIVSASQITDETRLGTLSGLLDGDSYLIPSRVEAVKIFEIEVEMRFEPARLEDEHGDAPHDGKNSFLLLFFKSKVGDSWIEGGEYI